MREMTCGTAVAVQGKLPHVAARERKANEMNVKMLHASATVALLWAAAGHADDVQQTQDGKHDTVHSAMHEAMQKQMATPPVTAQMPGMADRAAADATAARQHAAQMQQVRDAARQRAMAHGARDAAMTRDDPSMRGGAGMMGGDSNTTQQGAGMMRTGDMHGGSGGMMPGGGGGGMMGGSATSTGTTTGTTPTK